MDGISCLSGSGLNQWVVRSKREEIELEVVRPRVDAVCAARNSAVGVSIEVVVSRARIGGFGLGLIRR